MESLLTSSRNRYLLLLGFIGLILLGGGIFTFKSGALSPSTKVEVLGTNEGPDSREDITAEISGEVVKPGVYKLPDGARINDLLVASGGLTSLADRSWTDKYLNQAAKVIDGQKVYIPKIGQQTGGGSAKTSGGDQTTSPPFLSDSTKLININSASLSQLDSLPGIGQVYGQSIIEHRPYSNTSELLSKGVLKTSVYNKIKDMVSVY